MSKDPTPTYEQCTTLADRVRSGDLSAEQRELLATLLTEIGVSMRVLAQRAQPGPGAEQARLTVCWEPVGKAYAELVTAATVTRPGGQGHSV